MKTNDLGKYVVIGLSALSMYEIGSLVISQLNDYISNYIEMRIVESLKKEYEIISCLGKYVFLHQL